MRKILNGIKFACLVLLVLLLANALIIFSIAKSRPNFDHADAAIVLGAAINTPALTNRTLEAARLAREDKVDLLVFSGGKIADSDISEAAYMDLVIQRFASDISTPYVLEEQSNTTYENINNSKVKLGEQGISTDSSVVIVSDEYHLARGVLLAKRAGFSKVYWSAPEPSYYTREALRYYYFREFMAMINYIPKFIFG